jgi:hypothetical protein
MKLKIFTKVDCPNCPLAKALGKKFETNGTAVEWYDLDEEEGLMEAVYQDVLSTPSLLVFTENDTLAKAWHGKVPEENELKKALKIEE